MPQSEIVSLIAGLIKQKPDWDWYTMAKGDLDIREDGAPWTDLVLRRIHKDVKRWCFSPHVLLEHH